MNNKTELKNFAETDKKEEKRCHKCNVPVTEEKYNLLEIRCMVGSCPIEKITEEKGCPFCGASYIAILKNSIIDNLTQPTPTIYSFSII